MKIKILNIIGTFFAVLVLIAGCKKDAPVTLPSQMDTWGVRNITATTAELSGIVVAGDYTEYGVCWGTAANPTIDGNKASVENPEEAVYWVTAEGLELLTKYYARAYAISNGEVTYGEEADFTTANGLATISTDSIKDIEKTSATVYGTVTAQSSDASVTERGFCWSLTEEPTISDNTVTLGSGDGSFSAAITDLMPGTTYYIRAYATSIGGMVYGEEITLNTIPDEYFLVGSINGWNNHGLYLANLGDDIHVGYQYLDDAAEFKILPVRDSWDNAWGRDGSNVGTVIAGGSDNIKSIDEPTYSGPGFYEIRFNLANETVTLSLITTIGVIGDAQAGGWSTDVDLVYNIVSKKWEGQVDFLATGTYKFRVNNDWVIDFGGDLNNLIVSTGDNITTPGAGTWNVTLDLGGENAFTATVSQYPDALYMVGDATAYGWTEPGTAADADEALFHKVAGGNDGLYWKICHITGGSGFKISAANWNSPNLGYAEVTEFDVNGVAVSDNGGNMSIATSGMHMVVVDLRGGNVKVSVKAPQVYGMGDAFGGWTTEVPANLFTVDNVAKTITSPSVPADGNLRMYVDHAWIPDWWQAEFVVNGSVIEYRNDGGDPPAIPVTTGQVITLSFDDNTGTIL
jgi:hypothetical protein